MPPLIRDKEVAVPLLIIPVYAAGLVLSEPMVIVLAPAVPVEWVRLPEPVREPQVRFKFARLSVPEVIVSKPLIDVFADKVTPVLLSMVRVAGVFCVNPFPVTCVAVPL